MTISSTTRVAFTITSAVGSLAVIVYAALATTMSGAAGSARTAGGQTGESQGFLTLHTAKWESAPSCGRLKFDNSQRATMLVTFSESDSPKTVPIVVGARLSVELQENSAAGYKWGRPDFDGKRGSCRPLCEIFSRARFYLFFKPMA